MGMAADHGTYTVIDEPPRELHAADRSLSQCFHRPNDARILTDRAVIDVAEQDQHPMISA